MEDSTPSEPTDPAELLHNAIKDEIISPVMELPSPTPEDEGDADTGTRSERRLSVGGRMTDLNTSDVLPSTVNFTKLTAEIKNLFERQLIDLLNDGTRLIDIIDIFFGRSHDGLFRRGERADSTPRSCEGACTLHC